MKLETSGFVEPKTKLDFEIRTDKSKEIVEKYHVTCKIIEHGKYFPDTLVRFYMSKQKLINFKNALVWEVERLQREGLI